MTRITQSTKEFVRFLPYSILLVLIFKVTGVLASTDAPYQTIQPTPLEYPIHAPWPAGITWHAGSEGSFYNDCNPPKKLHCDWANGARDKYAIDFNGNKNGKNGETNDAGLVVLAVEDGWVREVGYMNPGYGHYVTLGHAHGYMSRYAHLKDKPLVNPKQYVAQGTPLGYVGKSGTSGEHLHFAMYYCDPNLELIIDPTTKKSQCDKNINRYSQLPEPMEGITKLFDVQQILSKNFGVGYEEITGSALYDVKEIKLHKSFPKTYEVFGRIVFGLSETPVRTWGTTQYLYQEFSPSSSNFLWPWAGSKAALFQNGNIAYLLLGPSWDWYQYHKGPNSTLGLPISHTYEWKHDTSLGIRESFRNDFEGGSIIWFPQGDAQVIDKTNAGWITNIYPEKDVYSNPSITRYDEYIDFEWIPSHEVGSIKQNAHLGPSIKCETEVGGISLYKISVSIQGHIRIEIDERNVLSHDSPDQLWTGESTQIRWSSKQIVVKFWQDPGKKAKIYVTGVDLFPIRDVFASEGEIEITSIPESPQVQFASYEPPPFPGGKGAPPVPVASATSTLLVIDVSGSMGEHWRDGIKIESAKSAANQIVNMIQQESQVSGAAHQVGLAAFTTNAMLKLGLSTDYDQARESISGLYPQAYTNIGAGLTVANEALSQSAPGEDEIIILLSDGLTNTGLSSAGILSGPVQDAIDAGTCIYTVGFGDKGNLDEDLLRRIADASGCGEYYYASVGSELERVYIRVRHVSTGVMLAEFTGDVAQGQTVQAGTFDVPSGQDELAVTLHWPGSALDLQLMDPRGRLVDQNYRGATIETYPNLIFALIERPLRGTWEVVVYGREVPQGVTDFDTMISTRAGAAVPPSAGSGVAVVLLLLVVGVVATYTLARRRPQAGVGRRAVQAPAASLAAVSGPLAGRNTPLQSSGLLIGRGSGCDLRLQERAVSRQHARFRYAQGAWFIQDLGSSRGTFVNGKRIQATRLNPGDQIQIGSSKFVLQVNP